MRTSTFNRLARRTAAAQARDKRVPKRTAKHMARESRQDTVFNGYLKTLDFYAARGIHLA